MTVSIDLGFGDIVEPIERTLELGWEAAGSPICGSVSMLCYPPEFIFAEKLHSVIAFGSSTSRMKDIYDLLKMIHADSLLNVSRLKFVIPRVFDRRQTVLKLALQMSSDELNQMQIHWERFRSRLNRGDLPLHISQCFSQLNRWLKNFAKD